MTGPAVPAGGEELREVMRQELDDSVLTHTGRSVGDIASDRVMDDLWPLVRAVAEEHAKRRAAEELRAAAKWALLEAASHEGYAAKGMARNSDLRAAEARVFRAASNRLTARASALAPENARPE